MFLWCRKPLVLSLSFFSLSKVSGVCQLDTPEIKKELTFFILPLWAPNLSILCLIEEGMAEYMYPHPWTCSALVKKPRGWWLQEMFTCDSWFKTQQFASNWVSWHSGEDLLLHIRLESKPLFHTTKGELNWNQLYLVDLRQFLFHGTAFKAAVASPSRVCLPGISTLSKSHSLNHFKRLKCLNVPSTMEELSHCLSGLDSVRSLLKFFMKWRRSVLIIILFPVWLVAWKVNDAAISDFFFSFFLVYVFLFIYFCLPVLGKREK